MCADVWTAANSVRRTACFIVCFGCGLCATFLGTFFFFRQFMWTKKFRVRILTIIFSEKILKLLKLWFTVPGRLKLENRVRPFWYHIQGFWSLLGLNKQNFQYQVRHFQYVESLTNLTWYHSVTIFSMAGALTNLTSPYYTRLPGTRVTVHIRYLLYYLVLTSTPSTGSATVI